MKTCCECGWINQDLKLSTPEQLSELHNLEGKLSFAIEMGYINSFDELLENMRSIYNKKYGKF